MERRETFAFLGFGASYTTGLTLHLFLHSRQMYRRILYNTKGNLNEKYTQRCHFCRGSYRTLTVEIMSNCYSNWLLA